jgi:16S rRNA (cytidine1402-2'-O)-methyltransferase
VPAEALTGTTTETGVLSIVPTPIGDPDDISVRALRVLRQSDLIAAEHPHRMRPLLERHQIATPLQRCGSARSEIDAIVAHLRHGATVSLVCDVGTPTIADPGVGLVQATLEAGIRVVSLPGPTAITVALAVSGLPAHRFAFDGFPPRGRSDRIAFFTELAAETRAVVLYESAAYLRSTLAMLEHRLGPNRPIVIARDLTCPTEAIWRGSLGTARSWAERGLRRGQYTLVVAAGSLQNDTH